MSVESVLKEKLQKFSIVDLSLIKSVYFVFSLLIASLYAPLLQLSAFYYLLMTLITAIPLWIHLFSQEGSYFDKVHAYLKTNNPSNQVLLFLSVFFFTMMLASLLPFLTYAAWWIYVLLMVGLAIKPLQTSWVW